jgi:hypothetical protein
MKVVVSRPGRSPRSDSDERDAHYETSPEERDALIAHNVIALLASGAQVSTVEHVLGIPRSRIEVIVRDALPSPRQIGDRPRGGGACGNPEAASPSNRYGGQRVQRVVIQRGVEPSQALTPAQRAAELLPCVSRRPSAVVAGRRPGFSERTSALTLPRRKPSWT